MLYFEDLNVGDTFATQSVTVSKEEIIEFACKYDPQPFHIDEDAARESMFEGLIASGLQTLAVCNGLATREIYNDIAIMGGRGIDELRFPRPVRPGDTLSARVEITNKQVSESHSSRGYVDLTVIGQNQSRERVIQWVALTIVRQMEHV